MSWAAIIGAVVSAFFGALFLALRSRREDSETDKAIKDSARLESERARADDERKALEARERVRRDSVNGANGGVPDDDGFRRD